jgi:hypothetical protein
MNKTDRTTDALRASPLPTTGQQLRKNAQNMADSLAIPFFVRDLESPFIFQHPPGEEFRPRPGSTPNPMGGTGSHQPTESD